MQSAASFDERRIYRRPCLSRLFRDVAGMPDRPFPGTRVMAIRPRCYLHFGQFGKRPAMTSSPLLCQQTRQRGLSRHATPSVCKSLVDSQPGFAESLFDWTGLHARPFPRSSVMRVGPLQDLLRSKLREGLLVSYTTII